MKNISTPIFVIDFEGSRKIGIVEYGVVEILGGEIVSSKTRICKPKQKIPQRDANFFGIDNQEAMKMPSFKDDLNDFCNMRSQGLFCAHNAIVEDSLLRDVLPCPPYVPVFYDAKSVPTWSPWLDTLILLKNIFPSMESAKLSEAVEQLNLNQKLDKLANMYCPPTRRKWHSALYDALASALILLEICSLDGFEEVTLPWLCKYSGDKSASQTNLF